MKRLFIIFTALVLIIGLTACGDTNQLAGTDSLPSDSNQQTETEPDNVNAEQGVQDNSIQTSSDDAQIQMDIPDPETEVETEDISMKMNVQIGDTSFTATLEAFL